MKFMRKITCYVLSAALVSAMALPALAAENLSKTETVYTVLNADGSVSSQSVSVHLHQDEGLHGVEDKSLLTQIECTSGQGGFTQNGETLTWNVADSDAYYTGSSDRQAPVSAKITYALNGQEAPLDELLGESGRLAITIELTNHESTNVQIHGQNREICTPFVTLVAVSLDDAKNIQAEHGKVENLSGRQAVGFLCLPGVKDSLEGLLSEQLANLEDNLIDTVTVEADVTSLSAPTIMIACAADPELLGESALDELDGLEGLGEDMDAMDNAMSQLLEGAVQLTEGADELSSGANRLKDGIGQLDSGATQLQDGTAALQNGANALNSGSVSARDGAAQLKSGADQLAAGLSELQSGAGTLAAACEQLKSGSTSLTSGLIALNEKSPELKAGLQQAADGSKSLAEAAGGQLAAGSQTFADALNNAAAQGSAGLQQLPAPEAYAQLLQSAGISPEQQTALMAAYSGAYQTAGGLTAGLEQLSSQYTQIDTGIQQIAQGAAGLQQGLSDLSKGMEAYTQGVASAADGAAQLDAGLAQLNQQVPTLTGGVNHLMNGAGQLSSGAGSLRDGNTALAEGAAQLAAGIDELAQGTNQLSEGIQALLLGASELAEGTSLLSKGSHDLQDGLIRFDEEAISQLTSSVDPDQLETLNETVKAMKAQRNAYSSFSGTPEGVQVSTKFIMKTFHANTKTEIPPIEEEVPAEEDTRSFWDRLTGLFH